MSQSDRRTVPERLDIFPSGEIGILWGDGHESFYPGRYLRIECRCAACVDEVTGQRVLDPETVPAAIVPRMAQGVGNYGVAFVWSDGHSTGIYSHALLRDLCPCESCDPASHRHGH